MTASELAQHLKITKQAVLRRAKKENWPFSPKPVRGGIQRFYNYSALPRDIRKKIKIEKLIIKQANALIDGILDNPKFHKAQIYFLCFAAGFFAKVIIDIINK